MSESHCTNPTGGLLIRLKHKKQIFRLSVKDFRGGEQVNESID